jgi:uncharacterized protein (UPF0332 family)
VTEEQSLAAQLTGMLQKSKRTLESARILLEDEDGEGASSKAYYAVFHMLQAVLLTKGLTYSKHSGVVAGFSQHFVKSGLFPVQSASVIRHLRRDREVGDYSYTEVLSSEEASKDVELAAELMAVLEKYLQLFLLDK